MREKARNAPNELKYLTRSEFQEKIAHVVVLLLPETSEGIRS